MVCTAAFGMGVDVPDIEEVVRLGCPPPPTLEELVQEFGRAGRDGRPAKEHVESEILANTKRNSSLF